jgi:CheY-like chemotaxis protein
LHGGAIHAESPGLGKGATFILELPLAGEPAALAAQPKSPARRPVQGYGRKVLIVDDNRDAAQSLKLLIEMQDCEVSVAHSGPDGVRLAREWRPDAVLCDIGMPGMDGFAVAQELRRNPSTQGLRLIAVSGYGSQADRERALRSGFDDHVVKPADPDVLLEKLQ